jgi:hypothetical protein
MNPRPSSQSRNSNAFSLTMLAQMLGCWIPLVRTLIGNAKPTLSLSLRRGHLASPLETHALRGVGYPLSSSDALWRVSRTTGPRRSGPASVARGRDSLPRPSALVRESCADQRLPRRFRGKCRCPSRRDGQPVRQRPVRQRHTLGCRGGRARATRSPLAVYLRSNVQETHSRDHNDGRHCASRAPERRPVKAPATVCSLPAVEADEDPEAGKSVGRSCLLYAST